MLLSVFTALFDLRVAVPVLTLTQIVSNGSRVWLNRAELNGRLTGRFAAGAVPFAVLGTRNADRRAYRASPAVAPRRDAANRAESPTASDRRRRDG